MKADPKGVLTGSHFVDGDVACAEGCIAAGVRFVAGYPITPSTEIVERYAARIPKVGGIFIQMEDELAASIAILGGAWAGKKVMTVTSGPGFSLMMEHIGLAIMLETPCMYVNVQRGGPSTGLPTQPGQADMMQARWGSHGDYKTIALCPQSPQECFDLAIVGMNLAEKYRVPVLFMMDECVGHMTERVVIPKAEEIEVQARRYTKKAPAEYLPYEVGDDLVPEMVKAGDGYRFHITGLTHDARGYPVMSTACQAELIPRLMDKITKNADDIFMYEEDEVDGADIVVVAYGITSRVTLPAIRKARKEGLKVGFIRLITVWPFPEARIRELASKVGAFVMPELNMGQVVLELERIVAGQAQVHCVPHAGGAVHNPEDIYNVIKGALK
ncbi:MAG: 2-oxoacid:acceptor oxidoreductase subunit alpha [Planctomycetes bacterium]|nr:2-oxoacid:acceptor oxidoreductase subunit alpha [Planctomycetota bacterium]